MTPVSAGATAREDCRAIAAFRGEGGPRATSGSEPGKPNPKLDGTGFIDKIFGMIRRIFGGAIRSTLEDVLKEPMGELKAGQARLEVRLDETNQKIAVLGARLDGRIDGLDKKIGDLTTQQNRMVEEIAGLKRDQKSADVVERRLARIEDRVFARAG